MRIARVLSEILPKTFWSLFFLDTLYKRSHVCTIKLNFPVWESYSQFNVQSDHHFYIHTVEHSNRRTARSMITWLMALMRCHSSTRRCSSWHLIVERSTHLCSTPHNRSVEDVGIFANIIYVCPSVRLCSSHSWSMRKRFRISKYTSLHTTVRCF